MNMTSIWRAAAAAAFVAVLGAVPGLAAAGNQGALSGGISSASPAGPQASAGPVSLFELDVAGIFSNDEFGAAINEVRTLNIGAGSRLIGIGWDVTIMADSPSWLSEMAVGFGSTAAPFVVKLTVGVGDDEPGTKAYSSGGVVDLIGLGLDFAVDPDGLLRLEFHESFDDFAGDWDGQWLAGKLTMQVESMVPEPSTYLLMGLGLLGVGLTAARRARA